MKAIELRIGNLVGVSWNNIFSTVIEITKDDVKLKDGFSTYNQLKPIPLTEEWLLKFGFEWCHEACGYFDKHHAVYFWESGEVEVHPFCTNDKDCQIFIKHVHTLQNLYFALTGEELTLSE